MFFGGGFPFGFDNDDDGGKKQIIKLQRDLWVEEDSKRKQIILNIII